MGKIVARNLDARSYKVLDDVREKCNFIIFYKLDQETTKVGARARSAGRAARRLGRPRGRMGRDALFRRL